MELTEKDKIKLMSKLKKLLIPESIDEAFLILTTCDEKWYKSFQEEMSKKSFNTACCAIDMAKDYLIRDGKMKKNDNEHFGGLLEPEDLI